MHPEVQKLCDQAFHRFLRSNPFEISPESPLYDVVKIAFENGYSEGGQAGATRMAELIRNEVRELGKQ